MFLDNVPQRTSALMPNFHFRRGAVLFIELFSKGEREWALSSTRVHQKWGDNSDQRWVNPGVTHVYRRSSITRKSRDLLQTTSKSGGDSGNGEYPVSNSVIEAAGGLSSCAESL